MKLVIELDLDIPGMDHTGNIATILKDVVLDFANFLPTNASVKATTDKLKPDYEKGDAKAWALTQVRHGDPGVDPETMPVSGQILITTGPLTVLQKDLTGSHVSASNVVLTASA